MKLLSLSLAIVIDVSFSFGQEWSSLTVPLDAQSITMGESFVANPHSVFSFDYNPAALVGARGLAGSYSFRDLNFYENEYFHGYQITVVGATDYGTFGISYKRFELGDNLLVSTPENPQGTLTLVGYYDHLFVLSYAYALNDLWSVGINLKGNDQELIHSDESATDMAYITDIGILGSAGGFTNSENLKDEFHFGLSLQNFGTDLKFHYPPSTEQEDRAWRLPRFARVGFAYYFSSQYSQTVSEAKLLLTAEYKRYLNPRSFEKHHTDFWGIGLEGQFFEIIVLRAGATVQPYNNVFGREGSLAGRYGFGLNLPSKIIDDYLPISFSFDLGIMPLYSVPYFFLNTDTSNLMTYNIRLHYDLQENE